MERFWDIDEHKNQEKNYTINRLKLWLGLSVNFQKDTRMGRQKISEYLRYGTYHMSWLSQVSRQLLFQRME